jgi:phosphoglycerate dehydrogenase-like enzyme
VAVVAVVDPLLVVPGRGLTPEDLAGHRLVVPQAWDEASRRAAVAEADVVLTAVAPVTAALLAAAPRVGLVAKPGAGVDNIDVAAARERGVRVCHAPGTRGSAVAEHALWSLLHLARRGWEPLRRGGPLPLDLGGRTLGLLGLGDIGTRVARAGAALGMEVVASTPSRRRRDADLEVRFVDLPELAGGCDALVLCAPLTPATDRLVDAGWLAGMRPDAMLVNVGRGRCVVTDDLHAAMAGGHLHGAALDVTDPEPLPADHPLRTLPNVLVTPHVAGLSVAAQRRAVQVLLRNVRAHLAGEVPPDLVPAAGG